MRFLTAVVLAPVAVLASCVGVAPYANFNLVSLNDGTTCKLLYDGNAAAIDHRKNGNFVFATGDKCPATLPADQSVKVNRRQSIALGDKGGFAKIRSFPNSDTNIVDQVVVRNNDGTYRGSYGKYKLFYSKFKAPPTPPITLYDVTAIPPDGSWQSTSRNGLTLQADSSNGTVTASISGTATADGYINLEPKPVFPATRGEKWGFRVGATTQEALPEKIEVHVAVLGDHNKYLGELVNSSVRVAGTNSKPYEIAGTVPDGAVSLRPYIQFKYTSGQKATAKLVIESAEIGKVQ
jgi:hypothetical protein